MARFIECDGCGLQLPADLKSSEGIRPFELKGPPATNSLWEADLCKACLKRVSDPKTWPRETQNDPD